MVIELPLLKSANTLKPCNLQTVDITDWIKLMDSNPQCTIYMPIIVNAVGPQNNVLAMPGIKARPTTQK